MKKLTKDLIIIPDVHGRTFWKECVAGREDNPIIFLGDYLDPYPNEEISFEDAIINFEEIIDFAGTHKNVILLLGNHDLGYYLGKDICSARRNYTYADDVTKMFEDNIKLFKLAYEIEVNKKRYIFSHAGLTYEWLLNRPNILDIFDKDKDNIVEFVNKSFNNGNPEGWFTCMLGEYDNYRGYFGTNYGSIIWCDIREWIFDTNITKYAYQIFGHSQLKNTGEPIITTDYACLDCRAGFILSKNGELNVIGDTHIE